MSVFKNGNYYHYEFIVDGRRIRGSTGQTNKQLAIQEERRQRERREKTYQQIVEEEVRTHQRKTVQQAADEFFADYKLKHRSPTYAKYALDHVTELLGDRLIVEVTPKIVKKYQSNRLAANAGAKTINNEVLLLLRLCGDQGDLIRSQLRRAKSLKLKVPPSPGRPFGADEKSRMLAEARKLRTPQLFAALALDLNTGLRDKELREIRWEQIDLLNKKTLTVGRSKTDAGTGRVIPLNDTVVARAHGACGVVRVALRRVQTRVVRVRFRLAAAERSHAIDYIVQTGWKKTVEQGQQCCCCLSPRHTGPGLYSPLAGCPAFPHPVDRPLFGRARDRRTAQQGVSGSRKRPQRRR